MHLLRHTTRSIVGKTPRGCHTSLPVLSPLPSCRKPSARAFLSTTRKLEAKNQIFAPVRRPDDFHSYLLLSSSSRTPLITFWTTSWCSTCRVVAPLIQSVVESGVGEAEGGIGYCVVEYDSPDIMSEGLGLTYMITSIPTLLSFDAQEAQVQTKIQDARQLGDRQFLEEWIRNEARRHGDRGGGGGGGNPFGGLFSSWRK